MTITNIELLAKFVSTAQAAYGELTFLGLKQALIDTADFTITEAQAFVDRYRLIDQQPNTPDGFSAAVFQDKNTGKLVLAIRGTEPDVGGGVDLFSADFAEIGAIGLAYRQAVDLYRYWRQLTTTGGLSVNYSDEEIEMLTNLYAGEISVSSTHDALVRNMRDRISGDVGRLSNKIPLYLHVDVTGHSLGGNLAYVFSRMFPQNISQVVTLNAPGLGENLLNRLGFSGNADITSVDAEGDLVHYLGISQLGGIINISQEVGHDPFSGIRSNHSSVNGVDGLNLLKLFSTLDPSEADHPSGILNDFMRASSNQALDTYENMLDGLRETLLGGGGWFTETPDATTDPSDVNKREIYYKYIDELNTALTNGQLKYLVGHTTLVSATKNYNNAKTDYGQFLSLYFLTPFALKGNELDLKKLNPDVYDLWFADKTLSEEDRSNGTANFSDIWYQDHAAALAAQTARNLADSDTDTTTNNDHHITYRDANEKVLVTSESWSSIFKPLEVVRFGDDTDDSMSGYINNDRLYGGKGNDTLSGKEGSDYLEGGAGDDLMYGGDDADQLYGGAGDDQLVGEGGNDILVGGEGNDTYKFTGQFGRDMIKDSDNKGSIEFSSKTLSTLKQTEKDSIVYLDDIDHPTYQAIVVDEGDTKSLIITELANATNSVTIKNWVDDSLGITLTPASEPTVPPKIIAINGDDGDNALSLFNKMEDDANFSWNGSDPLSISGGKGRDLILGTRAGNDTLSGGEGDDIIMGGNAGNTEYGKDVVTGDGGNDYIFSSPMNSVAHGGKGNDFIRADEAANIYVSGVKAAVTNNVSYNSHPALTRDQVLQDLLSIMNYDFFFFGFKSLAENLNEMPSVSGGKFLVEPLDSFKIGQDNWITGSDLIYSSTVSAFAYDYDKGLVGQHKQYWMNLSSPLSYSISGLQLFNGHTNSDTGVTLFGDEGDDAIAGGIYSDELLGGSGKDHIWAGKGNDLADGGTEDDYLAGNEGNDTLIGGAGMDTLWGGDDADMLYGGMDVDELHGDKGDDYLDGGSGADQLDGGDGNNYLFGGDDTDADNLTAGTGDDIFVMGKGDTGDAGGGNNIYIWDTHQVTTTNVRPSTSAPLANSSTTPSANFVMANVGDSNAGYGVQDDTIWVFNSTGNNTVGILGQSDFSGIRTVFSNNIMQLNTQTGQQINIVGLQGNNSVKMVFGNSVEQLAQTPLTNFSLTDDHFLNGIAPLEQTDVTSADMMLALDEVPEVFSSSTTNSYVVGSLVNDTLTGNISGSTFVGGHGDDLFNGDIGNDTYLIRAGDDKDTINDKGGINHIKFDKNIASNQVKVGRNSTDLILVISDTQSVTVKNVFDAVTGKIIVADNIIDLTFYDGTTWNLNELNRRASVPSNETDWFMYGDEKANTLVYDYESRELDGGAGDDVYKYARNDDFNNLWIKDSSGNDTIELAAGIVPDEVKLFRGQGNRLTIRMGTDSEIYIADAFDSAGNLTQNMIENIKFADGTMWNLARLQQEIAKDYIYVDTGTDARDWLFGRGGKTIFNGGKGDDFLYGSDKDDVYQYALGDGNDVIQPDPAGNDRIEFTSGVLQNDVAAKYVGNDLVLTIKDGGSITVKDMLVDKGENVLDSVIPSILENLRNVWMRQAEKLIEENYGLVVDDYLKVNFVNRGTGGVFAYVSIGRMTPSSKASEVILNIDLDDFQDIPNGKGDIYYDRVIAHELVHAIMALSMPTGEMPGWFTEGTAEFIHGADSRVENNIAQLTDQNSFNALFKTTPGEQTNPGYAVSYIAVKLLDQEIRNHGGTGINDLFDVLKAGNSLSDSLHLVSLANGISDLWTDLPSFENHFRSVGFTNMNSIVNLADADTGSIAGSDYGNPALDAGDVIPDTPVRQGNPHLILDVPEKYWTTNAQHNAIETIKFADGTTWDATRIKQAATGIVLGTTGNDNLEGFRGNDTLYSLAGDDTLSGRAGNDFVNGGFGDDLYVYALGDGNDSIEELSGTDSLLLGDGILETNLIVRKDDTNLVITFGTDDEITVKDMFDSNGVLVSDKAIENIKFASGNIWGAERIQQEILINTPQTISGTSGRDTLIGTTASDLLIGDKGDDILNGDAGNDIYKYNLGDGDDVINDVSGKDILQLNVMPDEISIRRALDGSNSFYIYVSNIGSHIFGSIRVDGGLDIETDIFTENTVDAIKFADGSKWDLARIKAEIVKGDTTFIGTDGNDLFFGVDGNKNNLFGGAGNDSLLGGRLPDVLTGGDGNDSLDGEGGNDILNGGAGDDYLIGKAGNDIYSGGSGADTFVAGIGDDVIIDADGQDQVVLYQVARVKIENTNDLVFVDENGARVTIKGAVDGSRNIIPNKSVASVSTYENGYIRIWDANRINQELYNSANYYLQGTDFTDVLIGQGQSDTLIGGKGNDFLNGGKGDDFYQYALGDGDDAIADGYGNNQIQLGEGIQESDLTLGVTGGRLAIDILSGGSITTVPSWISSIKFANGQIWDATKISQMSKDTSGTNNISGTVIDDNINGTWLNDSISGIDGNDTLNGLSGNDTLIGGAGKDVMMGGTGSDSLDGGDGDDYLDGGYGEDSLSGGAGNDILVLDVSSDILYGGYNDSADGGLGDDIYRIGFGSRIFPTITDAGGNDVIELNAGWSNSKVIVNRNGGDLVVAAEKFSNMDLGAAFIVKNMFASDGSLIAANAIEQIKFSDGMTWSLQQILDKTLIGTPLVDDLSGTPNNDTLIGGKGDDYLAGRKGDDTYVYNLGDGDDRIQDIAGNDTVQFGSGITPDQIVFERKTYGDLTVSILDKTTKQLISSISVMGYFAYLNKSMQVENFTFADQSVITNIKLKDVIGTSGNDRLSTFGDVKVTGGLGDDYLSFYNNEGNNIFTYDIGDGNDTLLPSTGNNTIQFGAGITPDDVTVSLVAPIVGAPVDPYYTSKHPQLIFSVNGGGSIDVSGMFDDFNKLSFNYTNTTYTVGHYRLINQVKFANGQEWSLKEYLKKAGYIAETPPLKPTAVFDSTGKILKVTTQGTDTVIVKSNGAIIGSQQFQTYPQNTGEVNIPISLNNNELLTVVAVDIFGNVSEAFNINAPDKTAPSQPTASFDATGKIVSGIAEAGSTVEIKNSANTTILGSATADPITGAFSVTLTTALINKETVKIAVKDQAGNVSTVKSIIAPDKTPPSQPTAAFDTAGKVITGVAEAGSTVEVKNSANTTSLGTVVANTTTGAYSITLTTALINKETVNVTAKDVAGNVSTVKAIFAPDKTAPSQPTAAFDTAGKVITGVAEAGSTVEVKNSTNTTSLGTVVANATTGAYSITLTTALINKETVNVTAKDVAGNISTVKAIVAPDKTAPTQPTAAFDTAGKVITGVAEAGSTVEVKNSGNTTSLGTVVANATTGAYSITLTTALINKETVNVTAKDVAGNVSVLKAIVAPDKTAPTQPTAAFDTAGKVITGVAEAGSTVEVKNSTNTTSLGTVVANATTGAYSITLTTALINKETVNVTAKDVAGNVSVLKALVAPDKTAPSQPTAAFDTAGKVITGVAEAGSTVEVKNSANTTSLGTVVANVTTGAYSITLTTALINKETVNVTAKDVAGNISIVKAIIAPDKTAPSQPTAAFDTAGKVITGVAEAGSTVEVKNSANTTSLGTVVANVTTGAYSITLTTALINKETVNVTAKDVAGNVSVLKAIIAPDKTAPSQPTAAFDTAGKVITGVAEAGSTVEVKNSTNTTSLGTIVANATTGAYSITLATALTKKETVNVTAKDAAGNVSPVKAIVAPQLAAPLKAMVLQKPVDANLQLDSMIQAMAAFAPPSAAESKVLMSVYDSAQPILVSHG